MEQNHLHVRVQKIKDIEFFVNEGVTLENPEAFAIGFELTTNIKMEDNSVEMVLSVLFSDNLEGEVFMKIKTSNVFSLNELSAFQNPEKNEFDIPHNLLVTFFSLSISHSRALLAKNSTGTKFADIFIPIVNPSKVFDQLYGRE